MSKDFSWKFKVGSMEYLEFRIFLVYKKSPLREIGAGIFYLIK